MRTLSSVAFCCCFSSMACPSLVSLALRSLMFFTFNLHRICTFSLNTSVTQTKHGPKSIQQRGLAGTNNCTWYSRKYQFQSQLGPCRVDSKHASKHTGLTNYSDCVSALPSTYQLCYAFAASHTAIQAQLPCVWTVFKAKYVLGEENHSTRFSTISKKHLSLCLMRFSMV